MWAASTNNSNFGEGSSPVLGIFFLDFLPNFLDFLQIFLVNKPFKLKKAMVLVARDK